jgi:hypothetical protein
VNGYFVSLIRTWVPIAVGAVLAWVARKYDVVIDEDTAATTVVQATGIVIGIYYAIVRLLEEKVAPGYGWLLGAAKKPVYTPPPGQ